jgi:hypothetical protein
MHDSIHHHSDQLKLGEGQGSHGEPSRPSMEVGEPLERFPIVVESQQGHAAVARARRLLPTRET